MDDDQPLLSKVFSAAMGLGYCYYLVASVFNPRFNILLKILLTGVCVFGAYTAYQTFLFKDWARKVLLGMAFIGLALTLYMNAKAYGNGFYVFRFMATAGLVYYFMREETREYFS